MKDKGRDQLNGFMLSTLMQIGTARNYSRPRDEFSSNSGFQQA